MKKKENVFRTLARWLVRWIFGLKYEEKWFPRKEEDQPKEVKFKNGVPDDSELIVSPCFRSLWCCSCSAWCSSPRIS